MRSGGGGGLGGSLTLNAPYTRAMYCTHLAHTTDLPLICWVQITMPGAATGITVKHA